MDPSTKPGAGEPPHTEWRNRDYGEHEETSPTPARRWLQIVFALILAFMLVGMLWSGIVQPIAQ